MHIDIFIMRLHAYFQCNCASFHACEQLESWWRSGPVATFLWSYDSVVLWTVCPATVCSRLPTAVRVGYLASMAAFIFILCTMLVQRLILRALLSYQNWMYERRPSVVTKIWGALVKILYLMGRRPQLYRYVCMCDISVIPPGITTIV
jgi:hypothetical protein